MINGTYLITTDDPLMGAIGLSSFTFESLEKWVRYNNGGNLHYLWLYSAEDHLNNGGLNSVDPVFRTGLVHDIMKEIMYGAESIGLGKKNLAQGDYEDINKNMQFTGFRKYGRERPFKNITDTESDWFFSTDSDNWIPSDLKISDIVNTGKYTDGMAYIIKEIHEYAINPNQTDDDKFKSRKKFIKDIITGKEGKCYWWTEINFRLRDNEPSCPVKIKFEISLFGKIPPRENVGVGVSDLTIIDHRRTAAGVRYKDMDSEGRHIVENDDTPASKTAAKLDLKYIEYSNKWVPNTTQMAIMTSELPPAIPPAAGTDSLPAEWRAGETGYRPSEGTARLLTMDGKNHRRWSPEWKYPVGCTEEEKAEMTEVLVQNKFTGTSFRNGEIVMLVNEGGTWQPIRQFANDPTDTIVPTSVSNWSFAYMVSNVNYFFRDLDGNKFTYDTYEEAFRKKYYNIIEPKVNTAANYTQYGYAQLTSWDFMGSAVGGLRTEGHALGNTQYAKRSNGEVDPNASLVPSFKTGSFFGCVFPDGYDTNEKFNEYTSSEGTNNRYIGWGNEYSTSYFTDVPTGTKVFNRKDNDAVEGNIFEHADPEGGGNADTSLHQLPADIATNMCPINSGIGNGLISIKLMDESLNGADRSKVDDYLKSGSDRFSWLADEEEQRASMFGFAPKVQSKIQFRPLKAEVFDSLRVNSYDAGFDKNKSGAFGNRAWGTTLNKKEGPIAEEVRNRWGGSSEGVLEAWSNNNTTRFEFSEDIHDDGYLPGPNTFFPENYWSNTWQLKGGKPAPGGGFGIIGASCTVSANSSINFKTQNAFGMDDYFATFQNVIFGFQITPATTNPSFGGEGNSYNSYNSQALHVRIFHAHPKELTIYDPRFFAVHHFSDGIGDSELGEIKKNEGSKEIGYPEGKYTSYYKKYNSDIKLPTLINPVGSSSSFNVNAQESGHIPTANGDHVYDNDQDNPVWRDVDDWIYDTSMRGSLLPTADTNLVTIGICEAEKIKIVGSGGKDYIKGDTFTMSGTGTGTIVRVATVNATGGITSLAITDRGRGYAHTDFFTESEIVKGEDSYQKATTKLRPLSVNGTGAEMYAPHGELVYANYKIEKPAEAGAESHYKLSTTPPINERGQKEPGGLDRMINEEYEETVLINNKSDDGQYDLFFHYYNDVSHVFIEEWGFSAGKSTGPVSREQYMELKITPI